MGHGAWPEAGSLKAIYHPFMTDDDAPKSAYELAMARLKKKDAETGVEHRELTEAERASIAETRNFYDAKLAEREVLYQSARRAATELATLETLEKEYRRDRERLSSERDAKIARIRQG
jgi:hypothetical protein